METNSFFPLEQFKKSLTTRWWGRTVHLYNKVDSTNLTAMDLAQQGAVEGTVVLADQQLRGRGRGKRSWHSPAGVGIYCSIVLRPRIAPSMAQFITLMTAVSTVKAIALKTGLSTRVKWPNDILINNKKVAGILLESKVSGSKMEYAVIGLGINVNHASTDLPEEIRSAASSLFIELGESVDQNSLIVQIFAEVEELYGRLQREDFPMILEQWRNYSSTLGQQVRIWQKERVTEGIALDVTMEGGLVVRVGSGEQVVVYAGDVEHLRTG